MTEALLRTQGMPGLAVSKDVISMEAAAAEVIYNKMVRGGLSNLKNCDCY